MEIKSFQGIMKEKKSHNNKKNNKQRRDEKRCLKNILASYFIPKVNEKGDQKKKQI